MVDVDAAEAGEVVELQFEFEPAFVEAEGVEAAFAEAFFTRGVVKCLFSGFTGHKFVEFGWAYSGACEEGEELTKTDVIGQLNPYSLRHICRQ